MAAPTTPSVDAMLDQWRDRRRPPRPPRPRPGRYYVGVSYHRRHRKWVGRYKHLQITAKSPEVDTAIVAAYLRDLLAWELTRGLISPRDLNFAELFHVPGVTP